jgi:hypothetical protein
MAQSTDTAITTQPFGPRHYLVNPLVDALMLGGLSLLLYIFVGASFGSQPPDAALGWFIFNLSFFVNFPHFLASYQLLYVDSRHLITRHFRFFFAAVIVPTILIGSFILVAYYGHEPMLAYFSNAMFFLVGWHYVKQIFGGVIVTNALQNIFYTKLERRVLLANLYALWGLSWLSVNTYSNAYSLGGISYRTLSIPAIWQTIFCWSVVITLLAVIITHIQKYIREGVCPTASATICFASIYVWFLPALYHPIFFLMIPFFHSLQYLPFVFAFRRNKVESQLGEPNSPKKRKQFLVKLYGYLLIPFITGAIFFWYLPNYIDNLKLFNPLFYGPTIAMYFFTIFLNIHHYFIDNAVWKGTNPEIRKYIFQR